MYAHASGSLVLETGGRPSFAMARRGRLLVGSLLLGCLALGGATRVWAQEGKNDPLSAAALAAARRAGVINMKRIMIAMMNYHDQNRTFPAAFVSQDGKPLLSWRVALLPYFEDEKIRDLHAQFHLDEPWDSPHNKPLVAQMPAVYQSRASTHSDGRTVYLTPRGDATAFPGQRAISIREVRDGTSNTIALVEVDDTQAVPWTKPDDWNFDPKDPKLKFSGQYPEGANSAFMDGSVHFIGNGIDGGLLGKLLTMDGGEPVKLPWQ